jgi:hypothetical protein
LILIFFWFASRTSGANTTIIKADKKHGISAGNGRTTKQKIIKKQSIGGSGVHGAHQALG